MTSRTLSLKLLKGELKRKIWMYTLTLLVFLSLQPGSLLMDIDRYLIWGFNPAQVAANIRYNLSIDNLAPCFLLTAVFYGCIIFGYMFSRSKVDMYHSLPIKRQQQFKVRFISGIIPFALIELLAGLLEILVISIKGYNGFGLEKIILNTMIYSVFIFAVCFSVTIIALSITGNLLVAVMICAGLMVGEEFINMIIRWYKSYCLQTYTPYGEPEFSWIRFVLSPSNIGDNLGITIGAYPGRFILLVAEAVVVTLIAVYLYTIRPSESAGKAVCYKVLQPIIRIPVVIVAALAGGIYLVFVSGEFMTAGWYWMIFILVGVITHVVLEIILQLDFKKALKHWPQLIASLAIAAFIACFFLYDIGGYDRYIPNENKVGSYAISLDNIDADMSYYKIPDGDGDIEWLDRQRYILDQMQADQTGAVRQLAALGVAGIDPERSVFKRNEKQRELNNMTYEEWAEKYGIDPNEEKMYYTIGYKLRSGRKVCRTYTASLSEAYAPVEAVYDSKSYRDAAYQIDEMIGRDLFKKIELTDATYDIVCGITGSEDIDGFLSAYEKDLEAMKLKDIAYEYPLYQMGSTSSVEQNMYMDLTYGYYIYPSFTNTLNFLRSNGIEVATESAKLDPKRIEHIDVIDYSVSNGYRGGTMVEYGKMYEDVYYEEPAQITYDSSTDFEVIKEICDVAILDHFAYVNSVFKPYEDNLDINLYYQTDKGFVNNYYVRIAKGKLPSRVAADLQALH